MTMAQVSKVRFINIGNDSKLIFCVAIEKYKNTYKRLFVFIKGKSLLLKEGAIREAREIEIKTKNSENTQETQDLFKGRLSYFLSLFGLLLVF